MGTAGTISELWRYPVKSMQGERVSSTEVTERGLVGDRAWALVDTETGRLCSAKHPRKWGALFGCRAELVEASTHHGQPPVRITFPDGSVAISDDADIDARLSKALGRDVTLTTTAPARNTFEEVWPDFKGPAPYGEVTGTEDDDKVTDVAASFAVPGGFFDFSAIHLITTSTLAELARLSPESRFDVRRFRPNVVVDTDETGFVENAWSRQVVGAGDRVRMKVLLATPRCVMTTLPVDELPHDLGVLRATAEHNRIRAGGLGELPCAGLYASVEHGGRISVGDPVTVDEDRATR